MTEAPDTEQFSATNVIKLLESLAFQAGRARRSPGPEAVHDLRVAIRRFSQGLDLFQHSLVPKVLKKIRRSLKDTLATSGEVRNCDIALEYLSKLREPGAVALQARVQLRRKEGAIALRQNLNQWVSRKTSVKWRAALSAADLSPRNGGSADRAICELCELTRVATHLFDSGEKAVRADASEKDLHHLRLAAKKLRYTIELFATSYGPAANDWLERATRVQTRLGRINDCRTVRMMVSRMGGDRDIEALLKRKQRRRTQDFRKLWRDEFARIGRFLSC
jgi:CHAD domain-containing protein